MIADRYRLAERLGTGGMASVWAAQDTVLGRRVAVKILGHDAERQRFEREGRASAALSHPNIVRVYDYGESEQGAFIVFELLTEGTLEDRLAGGRPLPDEETTRVAAGIAEGLAYAHAQGLVHRDLKPANVLFDAEGRPKIADFGIARLADTGTLTEEGTVLGTAGYISPEQAAGERATSASDVYSFGVILYRMLTGRLPFEADDPMALAAMHIHAEPPSAAAVRADVPPRLESVAMAALAKDPADRPADGSALLAELGGTAATVPLATERTAVIGPRPQRRRPGRAAVLAALLLLGGAGVSLGLVATRQEDENPRLRVPAASATTEAATEEPVEPAPTPKPEPTTSETRATTTREATTQEVPAPPTEMVPTEPEPLPTETVPTEPAPGPPAAPPG